MYKYEDIYKYSKDLSLLYIEDNSKLLTETVNILENFFIEVQSAADGMEGLKEYNKRKNDTGTYVDLIITDINMPNMDGMELIKEVKKINPEQPIVVISAYNDSDRLINLIHMGINNFIMKPLDAKHLMQVLYKTSKQIFLEKRKDQFIIDQSKLASMGEMIDSIAHQWLQPINILKMSAELLEHKIDEKKIDLADMKKYTQKNIEQMNHLTQTLTEFRNFFKPNENLTTSSYSKVVDNVLTLLKDTIVLNKIDIKIDIKSESKIQIIPNEFKHVVINIICNAIDAFNENNINERVIFISTYAEGEYCVLSINDTAGGIPENILKKVFEPNFTTKEKGSGVGLYLSSKIIDKIGGKIEVKNKDKGACFDIFIKAV